MICYPKQHTIARQPLYFSYFLSTEETLTQLAAAPSLSLINPATLLGSMSSI